MSLAPPTITLNTQQQYFVDDGKRFYVYELVNSLDGKVFYVGKGSNNRLNHHVRNARKRISEGNLRKMRKILSIEKLGGKVFAEKLIENLSERDAFDIEELTIRRYGLENLTNLSYGGEGCHHTDETKKKIKQSKLNSDWRPTEEWLKHNSEAHKGHIVTEETRKKISNKQKGKVLLEEHRLKISQALIGRKLSETHKKHIASGGIGKHFGKGGNFNPRTEEFKQKISSIMKGNQNAKGIIRSEETKEKLRIAAKKREQLKKEKKSCH